MDTKVLFNIGYGLYVLTANNGEKDNGCIINAVMQVTSNPCQIAVCVNNLNYTCSIIKDTGKFNLSILTQKTEFDLFKNFGYQSGKDTDKFSNFSDVKRSDNGILYITKNTNSYMSCEVKSVTDLGSHTMFIAELTDAQKLSDDSTLTYEFYQNNIKPKPQETKKSGWRCKICNYVYEGETLPADFICPWCKHGVEDFEKITI